MPIAVNDVLINIVETIIAGFHLIYSYIKMCLENNYVFSQLLPIRRLHSR